MELRISIKIEGLKELADALGSLVDDDACRLVSGDMGRELLTMTEGNFNSARLRPSPWPPLAPSTLGSLSAARRDAACDLEARFQFVPLRLALDRRHRVFRTLRQSLPNLELWPFAPAGRLKLSVATGETDPVGGWVSDVEDQPAPQARIALKGTGALLRLVTVVVPFAQGVNSGIKVRLRRALADTGRATVEVCHPTGSAEVLTYGWRDGIVSVE